jgi:hypothetical protein
MRGRRAKQLRIVFLGGTFPRPALYERDERTGVIMRSDKYREYRATKKLIARAG